MEISSLAVNSAKAERGAWVGDIPGLPGIAFKVRALGNSDYRTLKARLLSEVPRAERARGLSGERQDEIETECLLETVLYDWRGFTDKGKPLVYSKETARRYLTDHDYDVVRGAIVWAAGSVADIGVEDLDTDAKN